MTTVYDKHSKHFTLVSAWVILNDQGDKVGTMSAKYPSNGIGKLYLYLHLHGTEMVQVSVSGCGFDKLSVAVQKAADTYVKKHLGAENALSINDLDCLQALCNVNHNFSDWNKYGTYRFIRAI